MSFEDGLKPYILKIWSIEYFIGKLIDFGAENVHLGTRLGYPVSVLLLQKQFLSRCPSQQIDLKLHIWEEEVERHISKQISLFWNVKKVVLGPYFEVVWKLYIPGRPTWRFWLTCRFLLLMGWKCCKLKQNFQKHCKINYPLYSLQNPSGFDQDKLIIMPKQMYHENCSATKNW
jgi:hypothetical protein